MSVAVYVVPERGLPGLALEIAGKALARSMLDHHDPGNGLRRLIDFFGVSPDEAAEVYDGELPPEEWFEARDGLATVRALLRFLEDHPSDSRNTPAVAADLRDFERVLSTLATAGIRWHLGMDY